MSERRWLRGGLATALLASNLYWWRRERGVRRSLTTSRETDGGVDVSNSRADSDELAAVRELSGTLDVAVTDLPDRVGTMDRRVRVLENGFGRLRRRYVEEWWGATVDDSVDTTDPFVVHATVSTHESVAAVEDDLLKQLGKFAVSAENCLLVAVDVDDGSFVVTVGEALRSEVDAADVARETVADIAGGAGGATDFAQGGGADPEATGRAVADTVDRLRSTTTFDDNVVSAELDV